MTLPNLTARLNRLGAGAMEREAFGRATGGGRGLRLPRRAGLVLGVAMLGGCVSVKAPEKPIVIELNINIKQEVVYKLAPDASKTIDSNKGIF